MVNQVLSGYRPEMASIEMPEEIRQLIQLCWSEDPRERPAADKMAFILTRLWNANKDQVERQNAVAEASAAAEKKKTEEDEAKAKANKKAEAEREAEEAKAKADEKEKQQDVEKSASKTFCSNCGAKHTVGKFCAQCGEKC